MSLPQARIEHEWAWETESADAPDCPLRYVVLPLIHKVDGLFRLMTLPCGRWDCDRCASTKARKIINNAKRVFDLKVYYTRFRVNDSEDFDGWKDRVKQRRAVLKDNGVEIGGSFIVNRRDRIDIYSSVNLASGYPRKVPLWMAQVNHEAALTLLERAVVLPGVLRTRWFGTWSPPPQPTDNYGLPVGSKRRYKGEVWPRYQHELAEEGTEPTEGDLELGIFLPFGHTPAQHAKRLSEIVEEVRQTPQPKSE